MAISDKTGAANFNTETGNNALENISEQQKEKSSAGPALHMEGWSKSEASKDAATAYFGSNVDKLAQLPSGSDYIKDYRNRYLASVSENVGTPLVSEKPPAFGKVPDFMSGFKANKPINFGEVARQAVDTILGNKPLNAETSFSRNMEKALEDSINAEQGQEVVEQIGKQAKKMLEDLNSQKLYLDGDHDEKGMPRNYSDMLDALQESANNPEKKELPLPFEPRLPVPLNPEQNPVADMKIDRAVESGEVQAVSLYADASKDYDPAVVKKIADSFFRSQNSWTENSMTLADDLDKLRGELKAASMEGRLRPKDYDKIVKQLLVISEGIRTKADLNSPGTAGWLLNMHAVAAMQEVLENPAVEVLNLSSKHQLHSLRDRMSELGIVGSSIKDVQSSTNALMNDGGFANFTIAAIPKLLDGGVTLMPRNQTAYLTLTSNINFHEQWGHNYGFPLAKFPEGVRDKLVSQVVTQVMKENRVADEDLIVPLAIAGRVPELGGGVKMKTSEFLSRVLLGQSNENTGDLGGAAFGKGAAIIALSDLLLSHRKDAKLELRSILNSTKYPQGVEPHGIDTARPKIGAETMRQLSIKDGKVDPEVDKEAKALEAMADSMARPGDYYEWVSSEAAFAGQSVKIPRKVFDSLIPALVKAQLDTPLETLKDKNGRLHTFRELLPNFAESYHRVNNLTEQIAESCGNGSKVLVNPGKVDLSKYDVSEVLSAGGKALHRLVGTGAIEDPDKAIKAVNELVMPLALQVGRKEFPAVQMPDGPFANRAAMAAEVFPRNTGKVNSRKVREDGAKLIKILETHKQLLDKLESR